MNLFIFLLIPLCYIPENVSCSFVNLSVVGGITAYILNGRTADHRMKHYTRILESTTAPSIPSNVQEIDQNRFIRFISPQAFVNYTKQFVNNTINGAMLVIKNGTEYYKTISNILGPIANSSSLKKLLNISFISLSRKGIGDNIIDENKEVFHNIVDSCRELIRNNVIEMESNDRRSLLSKVNEFTQTQYDKICKQFNYCRTIYQWTRLGKEISINVGRMQTKKLIEFYGDFYAFYLGRLNVSNIMTPVQREIMKNKTLNLGLEPGYALRHLNHYATDVFDQNVTKYNNFTVHLNSVELDRLTYDEWDNLNEDLMAWGKGLSNDLRSLLSHMTLLTQILIDSWKPELVDSIKGDMDEIFAPDDMTI